VSISLLPNRRYRAQVYDPATGRNVSVSKILTPAEMREHRAENGSFRLKSEARAAREAARRKIGAKSRSLVTVRAFRERWITDPLFATRRDRQTIIHNGERTNAFAKVHGDLPMERVDAEIVSGWLEGGRRNAQVPALRAMWRDAGSAKAGYIVTQNVWAGLGLEQSPGNRDAQPPTEKEMWRMIGYARELTAPSFADYLEVACFTGIRPSELDAFQWPQIRWGDGEIDVNVQWNAKLREFAEPKYGPYTIALVEQAKKTLLRIKRDSDSPFVFTTLRGSHYTPSSRSYHWNRVRARMARGDLKLYVATKHYWGWYAVNVLGLEPSVVAVQFGHRDGGKLVERLYGHPDKRLRRAKIRNAFASTAQVRPLRAVEGGESA